MARGLKSASILGLLAFGLAGFLHLSGMTLTSALDTPDPAATPELEMIAPAVSVRLLSDADIHLYRRIFELQEDGDWEAANLLIDALVDDSLMGHILFQRYMHPTDYRSSFAELSGWMSVYADLPGANRIYRLAKRRQGRADNPMRPERTIFNRPKPHVPITVTSTQRHTKSDQKLVNSFKSRIRRHIGRGQPHRAEKYFWPFERRSLLTDAERDEALIAIAGSYFYKGYNMKALALASLAAEGSRDLMAQSDWIAGLAAWKIEDFALAARHFELVASSDVAGSWMISAGAFWATRAYGILEKPDRITSLLSLAAREYRTFYGLLASKQLGLKVNLQWQKPVLSQEGYEDLSNKAGVRRAIALSEIGEIALADGEIRLVWSRQGPDIWEDLLSLAAAIDLPASQYHLTRELEADYTLPDSVLYPIPQWQPEGGFLIDRALVYAFMRQESGFIPRARSVDGAMGLMQVVPSTASFITKDQSLSRNQRNRLYEPELNMAVGQLYMKYLLEKDWTQGELFKFATAYNWGPGNLTRWMRTAKDIDDPLLFIESVPTRETRIFIERVYANFWIYRAQLGQATPSLDALASGSWATYHALDGDQIVALDKANSEQSRYAQN